MNKILSAAFIILFSLSEVHAQESVVDSLKTELAKNLPDTAQVRILTEISSALYRTDPQESINYAQKALSKASSSDPGILKLKAKAYNNMGVSYVIMSKIDKSLEAHYIALEIREKIKDTIGLANSYLNIGNAHFRSASHDKALEMYKTSEKYAAAVNDKLNLSRIYNNIGSIYKNQGDDNESLKYYEKAASMKRELGDKFGLSVSLHHIGDAYIQQGKIDKGLEYLHQSLQLDEEINNNSSKVGVLRSLARAYAKINNFDKAISYAKEGVDLAKQLNSNLEIMEATYCLQQIYEAKGDYKNAYIYSQIAYEYTNKVNGDANLENIAEISTKYETERKELENELLKEEKKQQQVIIAGKNKIQALSIIAIVLMLAFITALFISRNRVNKKRIILENLNLQLQQKNLEIIAKTEEINSQKEDLIQHRNKLKKLNDFNNRLFSIISHDLRSPFASVKSLLNLSRRKNIPEADLQHLLDLLKKDFDSAYSMLNNLLLWAETQMDGGKVELETVNLHNLAQENLTFQQNLANEKSIQLLNYIPSDLVVLADKERLTFIIRNLLNNAIKFSFPGDEIELFASENQENINLKIRDKGKGMSTKEQELFLKRNRFSTMGTANEKGSGLGLTFSLEFLESMGGSCALESTLGEGTTFTLSLQKATKEELALQA